jgi:hypothetical protein
VDFEKIDQKILTIIEDNKVFQENPINPEDLKK